MGTMDLSRCKSVLIGAQVLLSLAPTLHALNDAAYLNISANSTLASSCQRFLCVRDGSSSSNGVYPWLINNNNARFAYVRTDSEGFATYSYQRSYNGQTLQYYLHFYDEGVFYNGFWVVNDLETGFVETTGRVFIYNSEMTIVQRKPTTTGTSGRMEIGFTTLASTCRPADC